MRKRKKPSPLSMARNSTAALSPLTKRAPRPSGPAEAATVASAVAIVTSLSRTTSMAKVHEYILVAADGSCGITKSNGPICFQQSRQEVGGHFETFDPQLGAGYTAQINEDGGRRNLRPNSVFEG